jgi:hypothetical protein
MEALSAADLLALWERGSAADVHGRALLLLRAARPDLPPARLGAVPLGARDAELLRLRRATFGERLAATVACPSCGEALALEIRADAIQPAAGADTAYPTVTGTVGNRTVAVRPPTTDDLIAAADAAAREGSGPPGARRALVARLAEAGWPADADDPDDAAEPPAAALDELEAALAEMLDHVDPDLELRLDVACPACGHAWAASLDIAGYVWTEVLAGARRVADEVAGLAAAYGWREGDVLALSPWRRRLYLDLAAG